MHWLILNFNTPLRVFELLKTELLKIPVPCAKIGSKRPAPHGQNNRSNVPTPLSPTVKIYRNYEVNKQNSIYLIIQCSFCSPYVCSHDVTKEHSFLIKCPQIFPLCVCILHRGSITDFELNYTSEVLVF